MSHPDPDGTFVVPPDHAPAPFFDAEAVRERWDEMGAVARQSFVRAIGPRASLREFGLPVVEVALAWRTALPLEARLEHCRRLARA